MTTLLRLTATLVVLTLMLALTPTATAQTADPHAKVSIEMSTSPEDAGPGMELTRSASVTLEASNFTCEQEAQLVVDLTVTGGTEDAAAAGGSNASAGATGNDTTGASGGLAVSVEPTQLNYTVSGTHQNVVSGPAAYNQSADAMLTVVVGEGAPAGPNDIALTATFPEQLPEDCQTAGGNLPQSSATANFTINLPEPEVDEDAFGNETDGDGPVGNETGGDSPSPGGTLVAAALGVAFLAAAAVRRKGY